MKIRKTVFLDTLLGESSKGSYVDKRPYIFW